MLHCTRWLRLHELFSQRFILISLLLISIHDNVLGSGIQDAPIHTLAPGSDIFPPRTQRQYTLHVGHLHHGPDDEGENVILTSVLEETSIFLPVKHSMNSASESPFKSQKDRKKYVLTESVERVVAENIVFDGKFNPLWIYVFSNRGFESLEWSACSGQWRPEWSIPVSRAVSNTYRFSTQQTSAEEQSSHLYVSYNLSLAYIRHMLSHHQVCSSSIFSFCANSDVRGSSHQFMWARQFMGKLLSSPVIWTDKTPLHIRPSGVITEFPFNTSSFGLGASGSTSKRNNWCSYHHVNDAFCAQHVNYLLNHGSPLDKKEDALPEAIYQAILPSLHDFFSSPFAHIHLQAKKLLRHNSAGDVHEIEVRIRTRMSFVLSHPESIYRIAGHWRKTLRPYIQDGQLRIYTDNNGFPSPLDLWTENSKLTGASHLFEASLKSNQELSGALNRPRRNETDSSKAWKQLGQPQVQYRFRYAGKDHGHLVVILQPLMLLHACKSSLLSNVTFAGMLDAPQTVLREGDLVYSLLFFPLHLLRPHLYHIESLDGSTKLENYIVDTSTNTLTALLRTEVTAHHVEIYQSTLAQAIKGIRYCYDWASKPLESKGVLLARLHFYNGWAGLRDMPHNTNSYRLLPKPIVVIERETRVADKVQDGGAENSTVACSVLCEDEQTFFGPHTEPLSKLLKALKQRCEYFNRSKECTVSTSTGNKVHLSKKKCRCLQSVPSVTVSGIFIPEPDASMMFDILILGVLFSCILTGFVVRGSRKLTTYESNSTNILYSEEKQANGYFNQVDDFTKKKQ